MLPLPDTRSDLPVPPAALQAGLTGAPPQRRPDPEDGDASLALALMRSVVQPVILMDPDGRVTQMNPVAQALLLPEGSAPPQGRFWWQMWAHADGLSLRRALADAAGGETVAITLDCRRAIASHATLVPIEDSQGRVAKVLCVLRAR